MEGERLTFRARAIPRQDVPLHSDVRCSVARRKAPRTMSQDFFILDSEDFIWDSKTRQVVAIIRNGEVFRDDDGARIAVFVSSNLYDL